MSDSARLQRVVEVVEAARRVAADSERLVPEIARTAGLSPEGVRLAFAEHLELTPSRAELEALLTRTEEAERVHLILSAGVFVGALRALAVARAASPLVTVRASRRDPVFPHALVAALDHPGVTIAESSAASGEVHVYGRDETVTSVAGKAPPGVIVRRHGTGLGVAILSKSADLECAARAVVRDVVPFDQRGCLSPRVVIVLGADERRDHLCERLHVELAAASHRVPRGALAPGEAAEATRYLETMAFAGRVWRGQGHVVASTTGDLVVPPAGRHLSVYAVASPAEARALLEPILRHVVGIGTDDPVSLSAWAPPRSRISALGAMQRPPLDGPVDLRALARS